MNGRPDPVAAAAAAVCAVLDLQPDAVRGDTPVADLRLDAVGLVLAADLLAGWYAASGWRVRDGGLADVRTVADLAAAVQPPAGSPR